MALVRHFPALNPPAAPVCSVCIANYNGVEVLDDCIGSVLAQQGSWSVEIIVHDDASSDGSVALLRERYPQVELLVSDENVGFCASNNRMVAQARAKYVLLLNNDAAMFPDALAVLVGIAEAQEPPAILTLPQYDWTTGELVDRGCLLDIFYNPVPNLDASRQEIGYGIGACLFMPRALWNDLGGFPEWFGSLAEDMYVCCLARLRGLPVTVANASGYRHRQGKSFGGNRVDAGKLNTTYHRRHLSERNKTAVMVICTPTLFVWPLLTLHFVLLAIEGAALALLKHDARVWREIYAPALGYIARAPYRLQSLRRATQRMRRVSPRAYWSVFTWVPRKLVLWRRHGVPRVN
jgi:GT2 family glycosyltransferase